MKKNLIPIADYARMCGVSYSAILSKINRVKNPMPHVKVGSVKCIDIKKYPPIMKAESIFNEDGPITIRYETSNEIQENSHAERTFETVSEAIYFCKDNNIECKFKM